MTFFRWHADTAAISAAIFVLVYAAGMAAQALDGSTFDACNLPQPAGLS